REPRFPPRARLESAEGTQVPPADPPSCSARRPVRGGLDSFGLAKPGLRATKTRREPRFPPRARPPGSARRLVRGGLDSFGLAKPGLRATTSAEGTQVPPAGPPSWLSATPGGR